jgi:uncharacterized protein (TIGR00251 family)
LTGEKSHIPVRLRVRVTPNAARSEITGFTDDVLHVKVAAVPEKGKANKELIDYLSRVLCIGKTSVRLLKGQTSRSKVIAIDGLSRDEITRRLSA